MDSGVSALEQFQQQLNVIANNIANVNTVGFKEADVNFADTLSETLGTNAIGSTQIGTGVTTSSITNDFSTPGTLASTGVQSNLAIQGNGFFVVKDPTSGQSSLRHAGRHLHRGFQRLSHQWRRHASSGNHRRYQDCLHRLRHRVRLHHRHRRHRHRQPVGRHHHLRRPDRTAKFLQPRPIGQSWGQSVHRARLPPAA